MKATATVQSDARKLASQVKDDGIIANLIIDEVESKIAARLRPVMMWQGLIEELGDFMESGPRVGSGPEGTNNPDRYVLKVTKKGVTKYGSFWQDFAVDLGVCDNWTKYLRELETAGKADCPADLVSLKNKGPRWIEAEKRTVGEKLRAAKDLVVTGVRVYQMIERLNEYDTIEVKLDTMKDGNGDEVLNDKTTRPFILRERYAKRDKEGNVVKVDGEVMYTYTDKVRYLSVGELIGLEPEEADTLEGGFSFDNLFKAAAAKRKREQDENPAQTNLKNSDQFLTSIQAETTYLTDDGSEKRILSILERARKDETILDAICAHAIAFDVLFEELKDDYYKLIQKKRDAKNASKVADKAAA